jgi:hypothetical protein
MATTAKAVEICKELFDKLKARLGTSLAITINQDASDLNPYIQIGSGVSNTPNATLKVMPQDWPLAKDSLGNTAPAYSPHKIALVTEANFAGTTDNVVDNLTRAQLLPILGQALYMGTRLEWYETAFATPPTIAGIVVGNLKAAIDPNVYRPMISSQ